MYALKSEVFPSFILVLMGSIDCLTTVIGVIVFWGFRVKPLYDRHCQHKHRSVFGSENFGDIFDRFHIYFS